MQSHKTDIVLSLRGRDAGTMFLVVQEDDTYLYLADGKIRRAEAPKRKKRRHTAHRGTSDENTRKKLLETGRLSNSDIRKALALWIGSNGLD